MYAIGVVSGRTIVLSYAGPAADVCDVAGRSIAQAARALAPSANAPRTMTGACDADLADDLVVPRRGADVSPASALANSAAPANRSAGSFSIAVSTASCTCSGIVPRRVIGSTGDSVMTFATIACAVGPVNGGSPVSISYVTAPSA